MKIVTRVVFFLVGNLIATIIYVVITMIVYKATGRDSNELTSSSWYFICGVIVALIGGGFGESLHDNYYK